jgi:hypothetical protein
MPKFLAGIVLIKTFETYASSDEEAREYICKWQESETEEPESGIKSTRYKLEWEEGVNCVNPVPERDQVLAAVLDLMQNKIPGIPVQEKPEKPRILTLDGGNGQ